MARKERKLKASAAEAQQATEAKRRLNAADAELQLTSEHLYRDETRVLTDMGGLFYAGVMKPLRPPDVYAITLDGERGNKSHVMSREDILKDTVSSNGTLSLSLSASVALILILPQTDS